jgi:hypothetical protein
MGRRYQTFVAPGEEEKELPIAESIWHVGGAAYIPAEHWDLLIDLVHERIPEYGKLFEKASYLNNDFSGWSVAKTAEFRSVLEKLCTILNESANLTSESTEGISEWFENSSYIEMIQTVMAVIDESLKLGEPFNSYAS